MFLSPSQKKGFTLIELILTISIFMLLSVAAVGNYRTTTKKLSLNSLANLVASDIRRAQVKGISNQSYPGSNYIAPAIGISFDSYYPNAYMIFTDSTTVPSNNIINDSFTPTGCSGECTERLTLKDGSTITSLEAKKTSGGSLQAFRSLHISFQRPDPEPMIIGEQGSGGGLYDCYYAEITITSKDRLLSKKIIIWKTGLVAIE